MVLLKYRKILCVNFMNGNKHLQVIHMNVCYWSNGDISYIPDFINVKENQVKDKGKCWKMSFNSKKCICPINITYEEFKQHLDWLLKK